MARNIGLLGVLAATGLVLVGALKAPSAPTSTPAPTAPTEGASTDSRQENGSAAAKSHGWDPGLHALEEIETFFATDASAPPSSERLPAPKKLRQPSGLSSNVEKAAARILQKARAAGYELTCSIALVPDPLDSQIGASFDQAIGAIVRGSASVGWLRDRQWLPWQADLRSASDHGSGGDRAVSMGLETGRSHLQDPGVLLFKFDRREPNSNPRLLALFLVGESHISGVEPDAFQVALKAIALLGGIDSVGNSATMKLEILGPTFSGSTGSIRRALISLCNEWPVGSSGELRGGPSGELRFISGSVTNDKAQDRLLEALPPGCRLMPTKLTATVVPDSLALEQAQKYFVDRLEWKPSEIALLTEADSVYGSSAGMKWRLTLPVPSGMAGVRSALERRRRQKDGTGDSSKSLKVPPLALDLPLDESGTPTDSIPSLAVMSAPLTELNANRLLDVLTRERIRHVGLFLTDVRDKLFFAQQLRAHAPSVSIFTFETSLLYTHPRELPFLHGMLVVSSYPLTGETQYFLAPPAYSRLTQSAEDRFRGESLVRMQFSSDLEEGLYNAAVVMLEPGCRTGPRPCPVIDYLSLPNRPAASPAVWITAVGQDRMVPLKAIADLGSAQRRKQIAEIPRNRIAARLPPELEGFISRVRVPAPFRYLFYLGTCLVLLLYVNMLAGYGPEAERWRHRLRTNPVLRPLVRTSPRSRRQWFVFVTLFVALTTVLWILLSAIYLFPAAIRREFNVQYATAVSTWSEPEGIEEQILEWVIGLLPLVGGVLLLTVAFVVWRVGDGLKPGPAPTSAKPSALPPPVVAGVDAAALPKRTTLLRISMTVAAVVSVLLALGAAKTLIQFGPADATSRIEGLFSFIRVSGGPGALSPLRGPLLVCIGLLAALAFELQRLHIRDDWRPSHLFWGVMAQADPPLGTSSRLNQEFDTLVQQTAPSTLWMWGPLAIVVLPFLLIIVFWLRPVCETPPWGLAFAVPFCMLVVITVMAFTRFLSLWYGLRTILERYNWSELSSRFDDFHDEFQWGPMRAFGDRKRQSYSALLSLARRVRGIAARPDAKITFPADEDDDASIKTLSEHVDEALTAALRSQAEGRVESEKAWRVHAIRHLDAAAFQLQRALSGGGGEATVQSEPGGLKTAIQDYLVLHTAGFIRYAFAQIRNSLLTATTSALIVLFGLAAFHFQPQRAVYVLTWSLIAVMAGWTLVVFMDMSRNAILSKIGDTDPGKLNLLKGGVLGRGLAYVAPPVVTLLVTQFPQVARPFLDWIDPLLHLFQ